MSSNVTLRLQLGWAILLFHENCLLYRMRQQRGLVPKVGTLTDNYKYNLLDSFYVNILLPIRLYFAGDVTKVT